ncbi:MAG: hypothetical protein IPH28_01770 [Cytophagaceae bacterium]|nr:hypothetical protein [Cytophagaceae bacterium]
MKKVLLSIAFFALISCSLGGGIDPVTSKGCDNAIVDYENAIQNWATDIENKSKCEAVKKSLNSIIKTCSMYTAAQRKLYEDQLNEFSCEN